MKKRTIALLLAATLAGGLAACGGNASDASGSSAGSSSQSVSSSQEEIASVEDRSAGGDVSVTAPEDSPAGDSSSQRLGRGCLHPGPGGRLRKYNHPDSAVLRTGLR